MVLKKIKIKTIHACTIVPKTSTKVICVFQIFKKSVKKTFAYKINLEFFSLGIMWFFFINQCKCIKNL